VQLRGRRRDPCTGKPSNPSLPGITGTIVDFGLSSTLNILSKGFNSQISAAVYYRAPELLLIDYDDSSARSSLLEKGDVWSFAMTLLEVSFSVSEVESEY
jgi:hypothetical protein